MLINFLKNLIFGGCYHEWGQWKDCPVKMYNEWGDYMYTENGQRRYCNKCGKKKVKS